MPIVLSQIYTLLMLLFLGLTPAFANEFRLRVDGEFEKRPNQYEVLLIVNNREYIGQPIRAVQRSPGGFSYEFSIPSRPRFGRIEIEVSGYELWAYNFVLKKDQLTITLKRISLQPVRDITLADLVEMLQQSRKLSSQFKKEMDRLSTTSSPHTAFTDDNEILRLKTVLRNLISLYGSQASIPFQLRKYASEGYSRTDYQTEWEDILWEIEDLSSQVLDLIEVFADTQTELLYRDVDTYRKIHVGLRQRMLFYEKISTIPPPKSPRELRSLRRMADNYEQLIEENKAIQDRLANYLQIESDFSSPCMGMLFTEEEWYFNPPVSKTYIEAVQKLPTTLSFDTTSMLIQFELEFHAEQLIRNTLTELLQSSIFDGSDDQWYCQHFVQGKKYVLRFHSEEALSIAFEKAFKPPNGKWWSTEIGSMVTFRQVGGKWLEVFVPRENFFKVSKLIFEGRWPQ